MAIKSSISQQIWDMKYRFKADDGTPVDKTMPDTFRRIAAALADPEIPTLSYTTWLDVVHYFRSHRRIFNTSRSWPNGSSHWA